MDLTTKHLYFFLSACRGNWRNTIYISDPKGTSGYLLAADRDGKPVIMSEELFQKLTGELIDHNECRGRLTLSAFEDIFAQFLLWKLSIDKPDILAALCYSAK